MGSTPKEVLDVEEAIHRFFKKGFIALAGEHVRGVVQKARERVSHCPSLAN